MKKLTTRQIALNGVVAGLYAAITILTASFAYGNIQFRIADSLCVLVVLEPRLTVGREIALTAKNGDISGTVVGSCDDFAIRSAVKKGESNLPEAKDGGEKSLNVSCNNGDISIAFQAS